MLDYKLAIPELIHKHATLTPNKIAIIDGNKSVTYSKICKNANQISNWLNKKVGVNKGDIVVIFIDPSSDLVILEFAIIQLGGIYVSLDTNLPVQRVNNILSDVKPKLIVAQQNYQVPAEFSNNSTNIPKNLEDYSDIREPLIYDSSDIPISIFYTSGSTGKPKGVIISAKAVINLANTLNTHIKFVDIIAQFNNPMFDPSLLEIWGALLNGLTLSIVSYEAKQNIELLKHTLSKDNINLIVLPTAYLHQLILTNPNVLDNIPVVYFGGEQVNPTLLSKFINYRKLNNLPVILVNNYGPTEATAVTCRKIINMESLDNNEDLASIGKPIPNVQTYILDTNLAQVKKGEIGELYISGLNLSMGYYKSSELNKNKFINNPFKIDDTIFSKLYKTGDLVKQMPNGDLFYIGRTDDQVKVGGFRVHLSEIENQLLQHPAIASVAVVADQLGNGKLSIIAYIVFSSQALEIYYDELFDFLSTVLPQYMIPNRYIKLSELPLNNIGKVDKNKLKEVPQVEIDSIENHEISNSTEKEIYSIWRKLLNRKSLNIYKNLFELGATSLLLAESCTQINKTLNLQLTISDIIANPSIRKLATFIDNNSNKEIIQRHISEKLDIAIVGFSCRFPQADSWIEFWDNLCQGYDCITNFENDLSEEEKNQLSLNQHKFVPTKGVISKIDEFDAAFFGFSPADAKELDPQQRVMLECAWEALEHSGNIPSKLKNKIFSVFAGMADSSYLQENLLKNNLYNQHNDWFNARVSTSIGAMSTQLSYRLNLRGKSINVNTACSTALVAVSQSCQDLILKQSDIALAGGVSIDLHNRKGYFYKENGIESVDGKCRPFSDDASGTVFSDGCGVVVLKRLDDAIKDNDTVYAVIRGCGINNDGSDKLGYTAPSINGQIDCIKSALKQAHISAENIELVETHGTATALGDVIEFTALNNSYRHYTTKNNYCALGATKGNIGHTDIAAGIAGLIKVALCLYYRKLPPLINFQDINPNIDIKNSPFFVNKELLYWSGKNNKYAAVSAFGIGGTNAHIIVEEHKQTGVHKTRFINKLVIFSAKNKQSLKLIGNDFTNYLQNNQFDSPTLSNIAYTLQTGRDNFNYRKFAIGSSSEELITYLKQTSTISDVSKIDTKLVFMFSGQGSQYSNMAMGLYKLFPYFAKTIDECSEIAEIYLNENIITIINNIDLLEQTKYTQPGLFIIEYALAKLFIYFGVTPNAMIGHSIGEYVAACISGILSLEDAIKVVCNRGKLMSTALTGKMVSIECTLEEFNQLPVTNLGVELALYNSTDNCVASGSAESITNLIDIIKNKYQYKILQHVSHAFHSYLMEEVSNIFLKIFTEVKLNKPQIPMISNLTGTWLRDEEAIDPEYWRKHLRYTVQFKPGIEDLVKNNYNLFLEIGPGTTLCSFTRRIAKDNKFNIIVTNSLPNYRKIPSDEYSILFALGLLWQNNININWNNLYQEETRKHIPLPTYKFNRQRYWVEPDNTKEIPYKDINKWLYQPNWVRELNLDTYCYPISNKEYTWLIFTHHNNSFGKILTNALKQNEQNVFMIESNTKYSVSHNKFNINPTEEEHYFNLFKTLQDKNISNIIILHLFGQIITPINAITSEEEINIGLKNGFYSILYMTRSYLKIFCNDPLRCAIVTNNSQYVIGTEVTNPINSTLAGLCKTIPQEHQLLKYKLIDIETDQTKLKEYSTSIINYCINDKWLESDSIVAIRNKYIWIQRYHQIENHLKINRLKDNGKYLITGGLGGIALTLCQAITNQISNPTFILVSRSAFPSKKEWHLILKNVNQAKLHDKIRALMEIEQAGGTVCIEAADVASQHQIEKTIQKTIDTCGEINGVIHAAGIAGHGIMLLKADNEISEMLAAKIYGTYNLARALKNIRLDFVMLCSSISSIVGVTGLSDYSSANACLDSFATSNIFNSNFTFSINWNTWSTTGMAVEQGNFNRQEFIDTDNKINGEQGKEIFLKILQNGYSQVAVSKYDIIEYSKLVNKRQTPKSHEESLTDIEFEDNNYIPYIPPNNAIEENLVKIWQELLGIRRISITDDFFTLGGHSLKALKFIELANNQLGCKVAPQQLYEHRTIKQLAKMISSNYTQPENVIVTLRTPNPKTINPINIFLFPPVSGTIFCYDTIINNCSLNCNIFGLQDPSVISGKMLFSSIIEVAKFYLEKIKEIQPNGAYYLIGYSFGGTVAYEVSYLLLQQNQDIKLLAMIDSWASFSKQQFDESEFKRLMTYYNKEMTAQTIDLSWQRMRILLSHKPSTIKLNMILFKATQLLDEFRVIDDGDNHWHLYNSGEISVHPITGNHETIIYPEQSLNILKILEDNVPNS